MDLINYIVKQQVVIIYIYDKPTVSLISGNTEEALGATYVDNSITINGNTINNITAEQQLDGSIRFDLTNYLLANPYAGWFDLHYTLDLDSK